MVEDQKHPFCFRISLEDGEPEDTVRGEFDHDEWGVLSQFVQLAEKLVASEFVQSGAGSRLNVQYQKGKGVRFEATVPPEEQISSFLHRLRPFVLNDESTNFGRVSNVLSKHCQGTAAIQLIKGLKFQFSGKGTQSLVTITSNDVILNSDNALMLWLNAHEYHHDPEKICALEGLHKIIPLEGSIPIFIWLLSEKAHAIVGLASMIRLIQGEDGDQLKMTCVAESRPKNGQ